MKEQLIATGFAVALLAGCAHPPRHGEVVMKASPTEAHVTLTPRDVKVGDDVNIYRDVGSKPSRIERRLLGVGTVTRLMGDKYAVVEVPAGVEFQEGDYVQRK